MRKLLCFWVGLVTFAAVLAGCGSGGANIAEPTETADAVKQDKTTLMIYMMGSDLEPKAGAASADLQEIAQSGIDLENNEVVICAGGSPFWHNEQVSPEQINILALEKELGFSTVATMENASMGTAQQLEAFLDYCWENYPNDHFALILWDHGNGPVMGYGKDILYGGDALLLSEMHQALQGSAFQGENKLEWIGFDACLMASAELSCLLADHADYLVASQEIEPAFGWDYKFLSNLGKSEAKDLTKQITEDYMAACDAYYQERGYEHYDVTLSVVDLSCAAELEEAMEALFSAATEEVAHYYDLLAMNRVQTRALGRATTGSEYDLVDLKDMVEQLSSQYPQEAERLMAVIERMVLANATSMESCCGMSLYYPFFNKYYYEKDWRSTYTQLGIFPAYQEYLAGYEMTWLQEDKLELSTLGVMPEQTADKTYSVTLSDRQAESFGSAIYHVLKRESGDIYRQVYTGQDVTFENNTLTVEYDGNAIYVSINGGDRFLTPTSAVDRINRLHRYNGALQLSNLTFKPENLTDKELPEEAISNWRYLLTLNSESGKVEMSGTVPLDQSSVELLLESGRVEDADMSKYGTVTFYYSQSRYITRYDNGVIKPLHQWYSTGIGQGYQIPLAQGYTFEYAPLANGEYYLMFEITDTQSGVYCTELLPITVENEPIEKTPLPVTNVTWKKGEDKVILKEQDDVKVFLITKDTQYYGTRYFLEAENTGEQPVEINLSDVTINGSLMTAGGAYMYVEPYDFMYDELSFGVTEGTGDLEDLQSLQFTLSMTNGRSGRPIWEKERISVDMQAAPQTDTREEYRHCIDYDVPYMEAMAEKQVIYETQDLRLTLMGIGEATLSERLPGQFLVLAENLSDRELNVGIFGAVINGYFIDTNSEECLPAGKSAYLELRFGTKLEERLGFDQIASMQILAAASEGQLWWMNKTQCIWCPVVLQQAGQQQEVLAKYLLWEQQGVRVSVYKERAVAGQWYLLVENNTQTDICLDTVGVCFDNGEPYDWNPFYLDGSKVGAGQKLIGDLHWYDGLDGVPMPEKITFQFQVRSFDETQVLFTGEPLTLYTKKGE